VDWGGAMVVFCNQFLLLSTGYVLLMQIVDATVCFSLKSRFCFSENLHIITFKIISNHALQLVTVWAPL